MNVEDGFDLTTRPWVRVRDRDGRVTEVSLGDLFEHAHEYVGLAGELPTQDVAVLRLLLAILRRSFPRARTHEDWGDLWRAGRFDAAVITTYLDRYRDRFDLLHPETPFYQVAGLRTLKGDLSGLGRLVADVPSGHAYFTTRSGPELQRMSYAEAARWLVHAQAFEPSGIKSGALGDDRVKGGKGYPIGVAWCGWLGLVVAEGGDLFRTLLLNLPLGRALPDAAVDLPVWERPPLGPAVEARIDAPTGPADLLTWPSRRIVIGHDGVAVTGVLIANGDPLHPRDRFREESMTGWRLSETQMKAKKSADPIFMPRTHLPERAVWRGLETLLATNETGRRKAGRWLEWLSELEDEGALTDTFALRLRIVGMEYGVQSSVVSDLVDDALPLHLAVLSNRVLTAIAVDGVRLVDDGVRALGSLGGNLVRAAGGDRDLTSAAIVRARESGYAALDAPYRTWVSRLTSDTNRDDELRALQRAIRTAVTRHGRELLASASTAAWSGQPPTSEGKTPLNAATAFNWFESALRKALPAAYDDTRVTTP